MPIAFYSKVLPRFDLKLNALSNKLEVNYYLNYWKVESSIPVMAMLFIK